MSEDPRTHEPDPSAVSTALEFPCSACGRLMAVRYLVPGERAACKACGAKTIVPDSARLIEYIPPFPPEKKPAATPDVMNPPNHCPVCKHPATPLPRCVVCGYEPAAVRLYNPKYFEHLAVLFSGVVPLWMAFSNFRRLGLKDRARRLLIIGVPLYLLIFAVLIVAPSVEDRLPRLAMALLVNYPVGWFLKREQRGLYADAVSLGGGTDRAWKGVVIGLGPVIAIVVAAVIIATPYLDRHLNHGRKLMKRGEYAAAAEAFERALAQDSTDAEALMRAVACRAYTGEVQASASHMRQYLRHYPRDARGWAILGELHEAMGDSAAADSVRTVGSRLNPNTVDSIRTVVGQ
jgi:tetratricopeptide repeat protein